MRCRPLLSRMPRLCKTGLHGCYRAPGAVPLRLYTSSVQAEAAPAPPPVAPEVYARLPPRWMAEANVVAGSAFGASGVAVGWFAFGGVVPAGVLLLSLVPLALGTVYLPRDNLTARALATSATCLPIGTVASALLEMAAWPAVGTACIVLGPALAAGYSCFHLAASKDVGMDLISAPTSPFTRLLHSIGLWNQWAPWAHQPFRDAFKLFFWYSCVGVLPTLVSLYGGWDVWLLLVLLWQYSLYLSLGAGAFGAVAISLPSMVPMEYKGAFMWLLPTATRLGYWSLNNPVTQAAWIYAFYALVPMCLFLLGYKWKHGVSSSPFGNDDQAGGSLFAGQHAFWG